MRVSEAITDRDIAIRAVAAGKGPDTPVREVMSKDVKYVFDDEDLERVAQKEDTRTTGEATAGVSQPGGKHRT